MPKGCCVPGCTHYDLARSLGFAFHRFPSDDEVRRKWIIRITDFPLAANASKQEVQKLNYRVCGKHFLPSDYESEIYSEIMKLPPKHRLKSDAVPSIFPSDSKPLSNFTAVQTSDSNCKPSSSVKSESSEEVREPDFDKFDSKAKEVIADIGIMGTEKLDQEKQSGSEIMPVKPVTSQVSSKNGKGKTSGSGHKRRFKCSVCLTVDFCKYKTKHFGQTKRLCNDTCYKMFRAHPGKYIRSLLKGHAACPPFPAVVTPPSGGTRECWGCLKETDLRITYHGLDLCSEACLYHYELSLDTTCSNCLQKIALFCISKYSSSFGQGFKQFCCATCLEEYKTRVKLCSSCNCDLSNSMHDGFMAPVGTMGVFRDFCTETCMKKYLDSYSPMRVQASVSNCSGCGRATSTSRCVFFNNCLHKICSTACMGKCTMEYGLSNLKECDNCCVLYEAVNCHVLNFEGKRHLFCTITCLNVYKDLHTEMMNCIWCNMRKDNFDMVQQTISKVSHQFCSFKCLSMHQAKMKSRFQMKPYQIMPGGLQGISQQAVLQSAVPVQPSQSSLPQIAEIISLAPGSTTGQMVANTIESTVRTSTASMPQAIVLKEVVIQYPPPKHVKNKSLQCKPYSETKATSFHCCSEDKEIQTGEEEEKCSSISTDDRIFETVSERQGEKHLSRLMKFGGQKQQHAALTTPAISTAQVAPSQEADMHLKCMYGVNAWKHWVTQKNLQLVEICGKRHVKQFKTDLLTCTSDELNHLLCLFVQEVQTPDGPEYAPDTIYYFCLGIQLYLSENGRIDNIFMDYNYEKFIETLNKVTGLYQACLNDQGILVCCVQEEHLWESKQLGAHSPHVLLNTLVYFNTRYFFLRSPEAHLKLSFSHIRKQWKNMAVIGSKDQSCDMKERQACLDRDDASNVEQCENQRCPEKLFEFYLSKCPEGIENDCNTFYLLPEQSCAPDSPVWYRTQPLGLQAMTSMINRVKTVREIQEAFQLNPTSATV